jgi:hypothetical protein
LIGHGYEFIREERVSGSARQRVSKLAELLQTAFRAMK